MAPRVAGQVTKLLFADNQHVAGRADAGADRSARLPGEGWIRRRAQQASAEATLQQAQAQVLVQQANVDQAAANVRVAEADLLQARQDYDRFQAINPQRRDPPADRRGDRDVPLRPGQARCQPADGGRRAGAGAGGTGAGAGGAGVAEAGRGEHPRRRSCSSPTAPSSRRSPASSPTAPSAPATTSIPARRCSPWCRTTAG